MPESEPWTQTLVVPFRTRLWWEIKTWARWWAWDRWRLIAKGWVKLDTEWVPAQVARRYAPARPSGPAGLRW